MEHTRNPHHFAEHLEVLRKYARPLWLQQSLDARLDHAGAKRSVVITFDDGYSDNLHTAMPMLESYEVPATFFLTTAYMGGKQMFWWDELEQLLLKPDVLPATLHLSINGRSFWWKLGEAASHGDAFQKYRGWKLWKYAGPTARHRLYYSLHELLANSTEKQRREALNELRNWAGAEPICSSSHRALSLEEAVDLAQGELTEIGAHSVSHPRLSAIPVAAQWNEIHQNKALLEEIVGDTVDSFAYPFGRFSTQTADIILRTNSRYSS